MAFCSKCGKQIPDGSTCDCQAKKSAVLNSTSDVATGLIGSVAEIVSEPAEGVRRFLNKSSWIRTIILVAIDFVVALIFSIFNYIQANIEYSKKLKKWAKALDMSVNKYCKEFDVDKTRYSFGEILKLEFKSLLTTVIVLAIFAVIIYFAVKLIGKFSISWEKAFAVASITTLATIPCGIVYGIIGLLPSVAFISWVLAAISAFEVIVSFILLYLAFSDLLLDVKRVVYALVAAYTANRFFSRAIVFILGKIFS